MKYAALTYSTNNLGDDIQTLAVMQHLPPIDIFVDRDNLKNYQGPKCLLVMNCWFSGNQENWPPSENIVPVFFGFHLQKNSKETITQHAEYLRKHAPIGCRDSETLEFIRSLGVEAYLSLCATLTFQPVNDRVGGTLFFVNAKRNELSRKARKALGLTIRTFPHTFGNISVEGRLRYAREILECYGKFASLIITSRIHCALPCTAMGIPVIYVGPREGRTEILDEIGLPMYSRSRIRRLLRIRKTMSIPASAPDITGIRKRVQGQLREAIETVASR